MKLLVTGYPPFDNYPQNATHQLIESMLAELPMELEPYRDQVAFEMVPFDNSDSAAQQQTMLDSYKRLMAQYGPEICLFCGQAASRPWITLETIAINLFKGARIDPAGPPAYWSTLPDQEGLIQKMQDATLPAKLSHHAGTHLCNHILYTSLRDAELQGVSRRSGFLHLPMTASQVISCDEYRPFIPVRMTRDALTLAVLHLLAD